MICDAHIHFIPQRVGEYTSFYKGVWSNEDALRRYLDEREVERGLLVYPSTDAHKKLGRKEVCRQYNKELVALTKKEKRLLGAGIIDIDDTGSLAGQIRSLHEEGFRAVCIPSSSNGAFPLEAFRILCRAAQEQDMTVFIHPQTENPIGYERIKDPLLMPVFEYPFDLSMCLGILMMEGLLQNPQGRVLFSSLGGIVPFVRERVDRVYCMLKERHMVKDIGKLPSELLKNVYVDTSGAPFENIKLAIAAFGEEKVLWGSDYPVHGDVKENLALFDALGKETSTRITRENFKKLFIL